MAGFNCMLSPTLFLRPNHLPFTGKKMEALKKKKEVTNK